MIEFQTVEDKMICIPKIDIVASNVPEMRDLMLKHLDKEEWNGLVLDCTNVDALDSVGVNLIVGLFKKAESAGKTYGTYGNKIGNAHIKWAFSEAAALYIRNNASGCIKCPLKP